MIEHTPFAKIASRFLPAPFKMFARQVAGALNDPPSIEREMLAFTGDLAVDVGANDGRTTRLLLSRFNRVIAFEPFFNVKLDKMRTEPRLEIVWRAANDKPGLMFAYVRYGQFSNIPGKGGTRVAQSTTLDAFFVGRWFPDFIKIDVEGFEVEVLTGAHGIIEGGHTKFFIEVHHQDLGRRVIGMFPNRGMRQIRHPNYRPGSPDWFNHYWLVVE